MAFALADAVTYVQACLERGLSIHSFAPRLSFFFNAHSHLFEEVAKFRAGRRLWARIMRERFGARDPKSWAFRVGIACAGSTLRAEQPHNNVVRVAYQALAAALGGVQSMFTAAWDEPFTIPGEESVGLALQTQQILAYETGIRDVVDPLGGSYYVESMTDSIECDARLLLDQIESRGGMVPAIESGRIQRMILEQAYEEDKRVRSGERPVVGVNLFRSEAQAPDVALYRPDPNWLRTQLERLRRVRARRDNERVQQALEDLRRGAEESVNLMPCLLDAVRAYATIGEITSTLRSVFGEFKEPRTV